jgi:hypothetical protein
MKKTKKHTLYNSTNYNSSDGMLTYVWGPAIWHFLHTISFNYPTHPSSEDKRHYMNFIKSLRHVLPCKYCRTNLTKNLKTTPITMSSMENRETFSRYVYQLHETINKMLNKQSGLTYDDVRERYEHFRARCLDPPGTPSVKPVTEKGCTDPLVGTKSKCVLSIIPLSDPTPPFTINPKCIPKVRHSKTRKHTRDKV